MIRTPSRYPEFWEIPISERWERQCRVVGFVLGGMVSGFGASGFIGTAPRVSWMEAVSDGLQSQD